MMLTPCGPSAVPTGGAGVAAPAFSWTLTIAAIFFFLGAISGSLPHCHFYGRAGFSDGRVSRAGRFSGERAGGTLWTGRLFRSDLADLIKGKLNWRLAAEDRDEHLQLLGVRVDLVHRGGEPGKRPGPHGNRLTDLQVPSAAAPGLGLLRCLFPPSRGVHAENLVPAARGR